MAENEQGTEGRVGASIAFRVLDSREDMLAMIASETRLRRACEVGVFRCEFSRRIMSVMRGSGRLDLVDTFGPGGVGSGDAHGGNFTVCDGDVLRRMAVEYAMSVDDGARVSVYAMSSLEWARIAAASGVSYGLVYIDADHRYEAVAADLEAYWPLVVPGGWLCGHDFTINQPRCKDPSHYAGNGVKRAVGEFAASRGLSLAAVAMDGYTSFAIRKDGAL